MSKKNNNPDPQQVELFVAEYQHKYSEAVSRAREAAQTTQTPAWMANYAFQLRSHRDSVRGDTKTINATCERIGTTDTSEDDEKLIRDCAKSMTDERIRFQAWKYRAVDAFRHSVDDCQQIIDSAVRAAQNAEQESPLINSGLAGKVGAIVAKWPVVAWDDETGVATVIEIASEAGQDAA